ncbi:hypothetical protein ABPG75_014002 [Micractinium tetrahymenae]
MGDCKLLDTPAERRFDSITSLLKDMLQVPIVVVSLIDEDRLWFKSVAGVKCRQADRLHSFCDISLRARNPTATVVPDTLLDPRFQHNQFVAGPPYVRFCAGCPLVSSDGHILGTLGVMDIKPRKFSPGTLNLLCNFGELVVREMEREQALERLYQEVEVTKSAVNMAARQFTARALSCFAEAVMLCDTSITGWPVVYTNDRWSEATGVAVEQWLGTAFWSAFRAEKRAQACDGAAVCASFSLAVTGRDGRQLILELRPAARDKLSAGAPAIGIPNLVEGLGPEEDQALSKLYFAVLKPAGQPAVHAAAALPRAMSAGPPEPDAPLPTASSLEMDHGARGMHSETASLWNCSSDRSSSDASLGRFGLHCPDELAGMQLGPQLGCGSCGRVFRGTNASGQTVAVKIVDTWVPVGSTQPSQAELEALLSTDLRHPHIVLTTNFAIRLMEEAPLSEMSSEHSLRPEGWPEQERHDSWRMGQGKQHQQLWMVQEYCDRGTLGDAVERGWLRTRRTQDAPPHILAVLLTAQEIASALAYLHSRNILHGDLSPGNVLLCAPGPRPRRHPRDPRTFQAKVADFGLSRVLEVGEVKTVTCGTVTHMPLELINDQLLTKATDSFAFGVLVYEMLAGQRAWAGRNTTQILYARTIAKQKLEVPAGCPPGLRSLVEACLSDDHTQRPSFGEIQDRLALLLATTD